MAGEGKRFSSQGYEKTKPLINVSGKPMALQALIDLPKADNKSLEDLIKERRKCDHYI